MRQRDQQKGMAEPAPLSRSKSLVELRRQRLEKDSSVSKAPDESWIAPKEEKSPKKAKKKYSKDDLHATLSVKRFLSSKKGSDASDDSDRGRSTSLTSASSHSTTRSLSQRLGLHKLSSSSSTRLAEEDDDKLMTMTRNRYIQRACK